MILRKFIAVQSLKFLKFITFENNEKQTFSIKKGKKIMFKTHEQQPQRIKCI
jgi:hypothetical protein